MGIGRTDNKGMTALEFKNIRKSLGFTVLGISQFLDCNKNLIKSYENETGDDGDKIAPEHAKQLRDVSSMPTDKRIKFIKETGCQLLADTRFK